MPNTWNYWNGSRWVDVKTQTGGSSGGGDLWSLISGGTSTPGGTTTWNGTKWVAPTLDMFWDGERWTDKLPSAVVYPSLANSNGDVLGGDKRVVRLPAGLRIDDFVVSVCVATGATPKLLDPVGRMVVNKPLSNIANIGVAVFRLDTSAYLYNQDSVRWEVPGGGSSTVANYVYRGANVTLSPVTPVCTVQDYANATQAPLNITQPDNTTLFLVVSRTRNISSVKFPQGVNTHRLAVEGRFGELQWLIQSGDVHGGKGGSLGVVALGATPAEAAAVVTIKVPGGVKGRTSDYVPGYTPPAADPDVPPAPPSGGDLPPKPDTDVTETEIKPAPPKVWILGDPTDSVLGKTTILQ